MRKPERRAPPSISTEGDYSSRGDKPRTRDPRYPPELATEGYSSVRSPVRSQTDWQSASQGVPPSAPQPQYPPQMASRQYTSPPSSQMSPASQTEPSELGEYAAQRRAPRMEGMSLPPRDYRRLQDDAATLPGSPRSANNPYQSNTTKYPSSLALASQSTLPMSQTSLPKAFDNYTPPLPPPPPPSLEPQPRMQGSSAPVCYDCYLKPMRHSAQALGLPRYISPTTGKCRKLKIQATNPGPGEKSVSGGQRTMIRLAAWLVLYVPKSVSEVPLYFLKFLWYLISIPWTSITAPWTRLSYTGEYKRYISRFWGQLWIARSDKEYSMHKAQLHGASSMPLASGNTRDNQRITHAPYPRKLMIYNSNRGT
jgi:hypothetical protein